MSFAKIKFQNLGARSSRLSLPLVVHFHVETYGNRKVGISKSDKKPVCSHEPRDDDKTKQQLCDRVISCRNYAKAIQLYFDAFL